ncbi:1402_t:CDS:2, partial [Gigaspora margarita]
RFSQENDMDPGEVPAELPRLNQVEEMLISQDVRDPATITENDWQLLNKRVRTLVSPTEHATFKNAIRPIYNLGQLKTVHSGPGARNASLEVTNGLEPVLYLSVGAHIMLIFNLWANQGLVNGAM